MNKLLTNLKEKNQAKPKGGLYHKTQVNLTYNFNKIENSKLAEVQTRYIFETHTIDFKDLEAVLVDDIVKKFHRILKTGTSDATKERVKYFYADLVDENFVK
jgi:hypothetical protein